MALQFGAPRDALKEAGASDAAARAASEEVAGYENRLAGIEQAITELRGEIRLLRWMIGVNSALVLAALIKSFVR